MSSFEIHGYALLSSTTLRDAWQRGTRYQRLIHESTSLRLDEHAGVAILSHSLPGGVPVPGQPAEFLVMTWLRFARAVTGMHMIPRHVSFNHASGPQREEYDRAFECDVRFSSGLTALCIESSLLDAENPRSDPALSALLERYAGSLLSVLPERATLSDRVQTWIAGRLAGDATTEASAAAAANMSLRSFHRGLRDEGTTWKQLLET